MKGLLRIILMATVMTIATTTHSLKAQEANYKWSGGMRLGMAGYLGEYSGATPFSSPGFTASTIWSYQHDVRWSFTAIAGYSLVKGSASNISGVYPEGVPGSFTASVIDICVRAEFNFFPYGIGETYKGLKRWTPYLAAGLGVVGAKAKGTSFAVAPDIPIAFGVRYKIKPRLNLMAEISFAKTFTDVIDGVKDIYGIKSEWFKNTDWTAAVVIGFTYEFGERCPTCHYVD